MEKLEPYFGMLFFVKGSLPEKRANLLISVFFRPGSVTQILGMRLGFSGKSRFKILFGF
jgi:hypothetical protein